MRLVKRFIGWLFQTEEHKVWKEHTRLWKEGEVERRRQFKNQVLKLLYDADQHYEKYGDWWNYGDKPN